MLWFTWICPPYCLSSAGSSGSSDPDRDVLWRTQLVHRQHPSADLKPWHQGPDSGTVQGAPETHAEPEHTGAVDPQHSLFYMNCVPNSISTSSWTTSKWLHWWRWWFAYMHCLGRRGFFMSASFRLIMWSKHVRIWVKFNWNFEFKILINT